MQFKKDETKTGGSRKGLRQDLLLKRQLVRLRRKHAVHLSSKLSLDRLRDDHLEAPQSSSRIRNMLPDRAACLELINLPPNGVSVAAGICMLRGESRRPSRKHIEAQKPLDRSIFAADQRYIQHVCEYTERQHYIDALMVLRADFGDKRSERRQGATMEKTISLDECPICHLAYDTLKATKHKEVARCESERMEDGTGVPFNQNEGGL